MLNLLDDTPVVPGDTRQTYEQTEQARQILDDAAEDLKHWEPRLEPIPSAVGDLGANLMPGRGVETAEGAPSTEGAASEGRGASRSSYQKEPRESREGGVMHTVKDTVMQAAPTAA